MKTLSETFCPLRATLQIHVLKDFWTVRVLYQNIPGFLSELELCSRDYKNRQQISAISENIDLNKLDL